MDDQPVTAPSRSSWHDLDPELAYAILRLRVDVFVVEQACAYPELDGRDTEADTEHVWLPGPGGEPVGAYLRVLTDAATGGRRIGRVVTAPAARGAGLAGLLLDAVLVDHGSGPLVLDAQSHLAGWYSRWGFTADGPEFVEDGIPHVPMRRDPSPSPPLR